MKALSIRQPWATMIILGHKPVENRTWKTGFRGQLLIHAAKTWDSDGEAWIREVFPNLAKDIDKARGLRGGVIGSVKITGCVRYHQSLWFAGPYAFIFTNPMTMEFLPCQGKLNFFDLPINPPIKSTPTQIDLFYPRSTEGRCASLPERHGGSGFYSQY